MVSVLPSSQSSSSFGTQWLSQEENRLGHLPSHLLTSKKSKRITLLVLNHRLLNPTITQVNINLNLVEDRFGPGLRTTHRRVSYEGRFNSSSSLRMDRGRSGRESRGGRGGGGGGGGMCNSSLSHEVL